MQKILEIQLCLKQLNLSIILLLWIGIPIQNCPVSPGIPKNAFDHVTEEFRHLQTCKSSPRECGAMVQYVLNLCLNLLVAYGTVTLHVRDQVLAGMEQALPQINLMCLTPEDLVSSHVLLRHIGLYV